MLYSELWGLHILVAVKIVDVLDEQWFGVV
jgi:hypothetical protein